MAMGFILFSDQFITYIKFCFLTFRMKLIYAKIAYYFSSLTILQNIPNNRACDPKHDTSKWAEIYIWHLYMLHSTDYIVNISFIKTKKKKYVESVIILFTMKNPSKNRSMDNLIRKLITGIVNHNSFRNIS